MVASLLEEHYGSRMRFELNDTFLHSKTRVLPALQYYRPDIQSGAGYDIKVFLLR